MMRSSHARNVRVSELVAALGGGALLAGSWVIVAEADHVSELEARAFAAINRLPDPAWPAVWVPMQLGSLVGSLGAVGVDLVGEPSPAPDHCDLGREPDRVLGRQGREAIGQARAAVVVVARGPPS